MSQQFSYAKSSIRECERYVDLQRVAASALGDDFDADCCRAQFLDAREREFEKIITFNKKLTAVFERVMDRKRASWYFVTVRPKPGVSFDDFYDVTHKYVNRRFMVDYKLSFEQKSLEGSGEGFHVHIVCDTKHRSKGECLRDTLSTFRCVAADNCVEVGVTSNPVALVSKYLVAYASDDGHKEPTKDGDAAWRAKMRLESLYDNVLPPRTLEGLLSSSPVTATTLYDTGDVVVSLC